MGFSTGNRGGDIPKNSFLVKKSRNRLFYGKFRHALSGMIVYSKGWTRD
jgi:hypothetical protein